MDPETAPGKRRTARGRGAICKLLLAFVVVLAPITAFAQTAAQITAGDSVLYGQVEIPAYGVNRDIR